MQIEFNRRLTGGLSVISHYTWSKNLTDSPDTDALGGLIQNAYDRAADRGNDETTPRHRWITHLVYDLPFGKGRPYLSNSNKFVQAVVGGWTTGNQIIFASGGWFTPIYSGADISNTNVTSGRPDRSCDGKLAGHNWDNWFDVSCFSRPPAGIGRFGNSGANILEGPGQNGWSTRIFKYYTIHEGMKLRFEGAFYNVLNHPYASFLKLAYGGDSHLDIQSAGVGRVVYQIGDQAGAYSGYRTISLGVKLEY
jgi:hypothetical protein